MIPNSWTDSFTQERAAQDVFACHCKKGNHQIKVCHLQDPTNATEHDQRQQTPTAVTH